MAEGRSENGDKNTMKNEGNKRYEEERKISERKLEERKTVKEEKNLKQNRKG